MPRPVVTILTLFLACVPLAVQAQSMQMRIARVDVAGTQLRDVRLALDWPADAPEGRLRLQAGELDAGGLGWHFRDLDWRCPLRRETTGDDARWRCDGPLRTGRGAPLHLALSLDAATTTAALSGGGARVGLSRNAATPDATRIDLRRVPAAWVDALVRAGWTTARLTGGTLDGTVRIHTPAASPLRVDADLEIAGLALETEDGSIAAGDVDAEVGVRLLLPDDALDARIDGQLHGGELLAGNAYVDLPDAPVGIGLDVARAGEGDWHLSRLEWRDGDTLRADGEARLTPAFGISALALTVSSDDATAMPGRYLAGWLGPAGVAGLSLAGGFRAGLVIEAATLRSGEVAFHRLDIADADGRFQLDRLDGAVRYSAASPVRSAFAWRGGALYGMPFDAAAWSLESGGGMLRLREPVAFSFLGGEIGFESLQLQPPADDAGLRLQTALRLDALDIGVLARSLDWPAFEGTLGGEIPTVRYADNRIDFGDGLSMTLFDGRVDVASLAIERPFGVLPTVTGDLALSALDLQALTGVFGFGSIEGRLHGRIDELRLVDWNATAFDAELHTERVPGVRQRISQRAVQDISSVGDASFVTTLQGRAIALFDDFGYRGIGISCRLRNAVCRMGGLRSEGNAFTIVQGAGLPRLDVVGFNRDVDWPTLVERLAAAAGGDVAPVIE
ncbi:conserved exported hypothetical protein [Luteimonas sp. 9C]|uniref:hypothetical protein n=1 Tax=Luteimonas sp. 9C TaxID=2653148 RepID=UPI0012F3BEAE|nr:hypothetical protein [Luteimonas sp. 9C]VXB63941.1 conserved exported hypothetical protein [Luteimonas sp. 9C]